jgi:hypothetical protein
VAFVSTEDGPNVTPVIDTQIDAKGPFVTGQCGEVVEELI